MTLTDYLVHGLPWWVQVLIGAALAVPVLILAARVIGPARALRAAGVVAGALAAWGAVRRARQQGWADHEAMERRNGDKAVDVARRARGGAVPDPERLRDDDGWRRD